MKKLTQFFTNLFSNNKKPVQAFHETEFDFRKKFYEEQEEQRNAIEVFRLNQFIGKPVRILYTSYKGTIHRCNKSVGGFYPGIQYPVYVKITESSDPRYDHAVGSVFEYGLDQIELI